MPWFCCSGWVPLCQLSVLVTAGAGELGGVAPSGDQDPDESDDLGPDALADAMAVFGARALSKTNAKAAKVAELKKETKAVNIFLT